MTIGIQGKADSPAASIGIGVYVDAFNLYYGARGLCGRGLPGWRWLDVRALVGALIPASWPDAALSRIVYCTARIDGASNPSGHADQDVYLKALKATGSVDHIEYGHYVSRVKRAPLAIPDRKGRPVLTRPAWPVKVRDGDGDPIEDAEFMISYSYREEKGSDVNVASHLLIDVLCGSVGAAIVISNDSDLRYPLHAVRQRVPVGLVNPTGSYLAGALRGRSTDGAGGHWWRQLRPQDITAHQLPDPAGRYRRPVGW